MLPNERAVHPGEAFPQPSAPVLVSTRDGRIGTAVALCLQTAGYLCIVARGMEETLEHLGWIAAPLILLLDGAGGEAPADQALRRRIEGTPEIETVLAAEPGGDLLPSGLVTYAEALCALPLDATRLLAVVEAAQERLYARRRFAHDAGVTEPAPLERGEPSSADDASRESWPFLLRSLIRFRTKRAHLFQGDLFADPCWDILLDLMLNRLEGQRVSVSSLCIAARVPPTTALRRIDEMVRAGWLERVNDASDRRRVFIQLSEAAADRLEAYLHAIIATRLPKWDYWQISPS